MTVNAGKKPLPFKVVCSVGKKEIIAHALVDRKNKSVHLHLYGNPSDKKRTPIQVKHSSLDFEERKDNELIEKVLGDHLPGKPVKIGKIEKVKAQKEVKDTGHPTRIIVRALPFSSDLAARVRAYLKEVPKIKVVEKTMFRGLAFLVNGKMCVNVSRESLMCRYDPALDYEVSERTGWQPMIMRGKQLRGYCYVSEEGYRSQRNFEYWLELCLDFNKKAKASR